MEQESPATLVTGDEDAVVGRCTTQDLGIRLARCDRTSFLDVVTRVAQQLCQAHVNVLVEQ